MNYQDSRFHKLVTLYVYTGMLLIPYVYICRALSGEEYSWHQMNLLNTVMSNVRIAVEWAFGDMKNYFAFLICDREAESNLSFAKSVMVIIIISAQVMKTT